jgi:hypothetical protein
MVGLDGDGIEEVLQADSALLIGRCVTEPIVVELLEHLADRLEPVGQTSYACAVRGFSRSVITVS